MILVVWVKLVKRYVSSDDDDLVKLARVQDVNVMCEQALLSKEAETMKCLRHPNLLPMYCSFSRSHPTPDTMCLVLPFVAGGSLEDILRSHHPSGMVRRHAWPMLRQPLSLAAGLLRCFWGEGND